MFISMLEAVQSRRQRYHRAKKEGSVRTKPGPVPGGLPGPGH